MNLHELFSHYHISLSPQQKELFQKFLEYFQEYNSHTNLSAIRDEHGIVIKHFIDSVLPLQYTYFSGSVLDIGSGGGFPGIPLKILSPDLRITLLDSVGKKVQAMNHFVQMLDLKGIVAIQERAEILAKNSQHRAKYDIVVSRATAYITDIMQWAFPFIGPEGRIILYKMPSSQEQEDGQKMAKQLGLVLAGEYLYDLEGKERTIYEYKKLT